mgnify:CR=1 FL=1
MGASFFQTTYRGRTLSDAYNRAVEDAVYEYGNDPYNGTIATTTVFSVVDKTRDYKASGKTLSEYIDIWADKGEKRQCFAICLEEPKVNSSKIKSKVEHIVEKGTKKWVLRYLVNDRFGDKFIGEFVTKGDAVKAARKYTESSLRSSEITMERKLEKGSPVVAKIEYKRSVKEKDGKWIFFGWAAE